MKNYDVIIIGGGAAGMMAAIHAKNENNSVLILEHNEKLGKKLYITGKGRCNLTNNSSIENHLNNIITNSKFMYGALNKFSPQNTIQFFESCGLKLKTERGQRVFPASDKASDVIKALEKKLKVLGVEVALNFDIKSVSKNKNLFNIFGDSDAPYTTSCLIIATGGLSYPDTGATGFGYNLAKQFGHSIVKPKSALCPILVKEDISSLNGLSLKNVKLSMAIGKKEFSQMGEMLFTYNSLTGPIALTLSSLINKYNLNGVSIYLDFKPALTHQQLKTKFLREIPINAKKDFKTYLNSLLPSRIVEYFMNKSGLQNKKVANLTKEDINNLINNLKKFDFLIKSLDNINVSVVTSGGVDVKEINPKTCESKLVNGLYFAGEVLDVDALTGGYNLQIAWSTGALAGESATKLLSNI